jgi:two-component system response regulator MprA
MHLVVTDDTQAVQDSLSREGHTVSFAETTTEGLRLIRAENPDAVLLDVTSPRRQGIEACRILRAEGNAVPVVMLGAEASVADRVAGFDAGADDYLVRPFALEELLARVRALLRRTTKAAPPAATAAPVLRFADVTLDPASRDVVRGGRPLKLTRTEFALLETFLRTPRVVLSRTALFESVWGYDFGHSSNGLDVYMGYLRRKLEEGEATRLLHTVRGVGYVLREE